MPADETIPSAPSAHHGDGNAPYQCHKAKTPPGAAWAIDFGYCRHSLDSMMGRHDPRCPVDCPHKAPAAVAEEFDKLFTWRGAVRAAAWAKWQKEHC